MRRVQPRFEEVGGQRLPLGGINGYRGVRGKQGRAKNKFQGMTPKKTHFTKFYDTAQEAAIALAQLQEDKELGMLGQQQKQPPAKPATPATAAAPKRWELGTLLGRMPQPQHGMPQHAAIPTVACALLSPQQAASAAARGVPVAYADQPA